ncbi:MAG TPA: hypothetical protein PKX01_03095, partial [Rhodocyclaceae bacterium]|nr:hypothetical protein [Rhodocyclaceae bacterium]HMZ75137.1 hypothetical protein [Rhodocyclaceae bacterium]HNB65700.1 hypothetical protein [Rhodocyclaceae bacterium]HNF62669.1 hypothetical protein [Rhodocyclaceae bacterium]
MSRSCIKLATSSAEPTGGHQAPSAEDSQKEEETIMAMTGVLRPGHMQLRVLDLEEGVNHYKNV